MKTRYLLCVALLLLLGTAVHAQDDDLYYNKKLRPVQEIDIRRNPAQNAAPAETMQSARAADDSDSRSAVWSDAPANSDNENDVIYEISDAKPLNNANSNFAQSVRPSESSASSRNYEDSYSERLRFEDPTYVVIYRDDWARDPWAWDYYSWRYPYYGWHGYYGSGWSWGLGLGWWGLSPLWWGGYYGGYHDHYYGWHYPHYYSPHYNHHHHYLPQHRNVTHNPRSGGTNNHSGYVRSSNSGRSNYQYNSRSAQTGNAPRAVISAPRTENSAGSASTRSWLGGQSSSSSSSSSYQSAPRSSGSSGSYGGSAGSSRSTTSGSTSGGRRPSSGR